MNSEPSIERLRALDPADEIPYVEPPRELIEAILAQPREQLTPAERRRPWRHGAFTAISVHTTAAAPARMRPRRGRRLLLLGMPFGLAALTAIALLFASSSGPGLNAAAAAYAATAPKPGVVEYLSLVHIYRGPHAGSTLRQQEWIEAAGARRRELDTIGERRGAARSTSISDWSFSPPAFERWQSYNRPNVVYRVTRAPSPYYPDHPGFDIGALTLDGVEGIKLYRMLYHDGQIRIVGHERRGGRLLWKLESHAEPHGIDPRTRLIVLVDPHTFLPVFERQVDITLPGHPAIVESELLSYRTAAPAGSGSPLFDLTAQHPGTHVVDVSTSASRGAAPEL